MPEAPQEQKFQSNVPELSVSELAFSLKRTLEESYGRIRVRGELSGLKVAASGHLYGDIKDQDANINIVCWKGVMANLSARPEEGLEVICTGKVSSYPKSSRYQIIIDSMELAGEGALLKMLEARKKMLAAEGLFAPERKKPLPFLPDVIGVVTSPTGAVIRDIMHRLQDRFPRHVLIWPVPVQGEGAGDKIAAAIRGFNAMPAQGGALPRPDVVIVARGGGSLEDLMAFNDEAVVRAAAECEIPLISAVGHETDTTLIDYAADQRAPTPTGAAEIAVPRRVDLLYSVTESEQRMIGGLRRMLSEKGHKLEAATARLGDPAQLMNLKSQTLDHTAQKLESSYANVIARRENRMRELAGRLIHPRQRLSEAARILDIRTEALIRARRTLLKDKRTELDNAGKMLELLSFKSVLQRGFTVIRDTDGKPLSSAGQAAAAAHVILEFKDEQRLKAQIIDGEAEPALPKPKTTKPKPPPKSNNGSDQGALF